MAYLSRGSIEKIARKTVSAYQGLPGWEGKKQFRVDPEVFARDLLGLSMEYHVLSPDGSILGATSCDRTTLPIFDTPEVLDFFHLDGRTILIEKDLIGEGANQGRYHFTLMHEACHQLLGLIFPEEMQESRYRIRYYMEGAEAAEDYWEEWRANTLASAILMPLEIQTLNRIYFPKVYDNFCKMAEYMGVSLQALSIRLSHLGLLKNNYLENPYRMVDIFPD